MPTVSRTFTVQAAPRQVLEFLKDFSNAEAWDPGTQRCTRIDSGPVTVGSRWRNVSKIFGVTTELAYSLKEATTDRVVFEGENKSATSIDTIIVTPTASGSRISYRAVLKMHGLGVLASPLMKVLFERLAEATEDQMTKVLNALPADAPGS